LAREGDDMSYGSHSTAPGEYVFESVKAGSWVVEVDPLGYVPEKRAIEVVAGGQTRVVISADRGVILRGRARRPDEQPFLRARVSLIGALEAPALDPSGTFEVRGLRPGTRVGVVVRERGASDTARIWITRRQDFVAIPSDRAEISADFPLVAGGSLTIR